MFSIEGEAYLTKSSPGVSGLIQAKSVHLRLFQMGVVTIAYNIKFKNNIISVIKYCKTIHCNNEFEQHFNNIKKTWKLIDELTGKDSKTSKITKLRWNGCEFETDAEIADTFSTFLCIITQNLHNEIFDSILHPV